MTYSIFKYFFNHVFKSKTRQKLILLSIVGLLISSFSLVVLQGIMGGLQNGLVTRSKTALGDGFFDVSLLDEKSIEKLKGQLNKENIVYVEELELELMLKHDDYISPVILHGMNFNKTVPRFLKHKDKKGLILGGDLGRNLRAFFGSTVNVTSVAHTNIVFQEVPRQAPIEVSDFYSSELPEIDSVHGWVRLSFLQNLIREIKINKVRFFNQDIKVVKKIGKANGLRFISWEDQNSTLVFALNLETKVMLFLFIGMSLLIGICISSGFLIFFNKIKIDLASFWIMGLSKAKALRLVYSFGQIVTIIFCFIGVSLGVLFLFLLQTNKFILMPDQFVERNVPVKIEVLDIIVSFLVPYFVSLLFTMFTFKTFKKENSSFTSIIKKVG